jgi:hypothetical protein
MKAIPARVVASMSLCLAMMIAIPSASASNVPRPGPDWQQEPPPEPEPPPEKPFESTLLAGLGAGLLALAAITAIQRARFAPGVEVS